MRSSYW